MIKMLITRGTAGRAQWLAIDFTLSYYRLMEGGGDGATEMNITTSSATSITVVTMPRTMISKLLDSTITPGRGQAGRTRRF